MARGVKLPGSRWSPRDWALQQAVDMLDMSRCGGCGQPVWLGHDKGNRGGFQARVERCFSCDAIAERQEGMKEAHNPVALKYSTDFLG